jgi:hypothetical protein
VAMYAGSDGRDCANISFDKAVLLVDRASFMLERLSRESPRFSVDGVSERLRAN